MPRTGTTALHKLLSTDPRFQVLESWLIPAPRVRPPRGHVGRPIPQFQMAQAQAEQIPPEFKAAHFTAPDEADECLVVLAQSFVSNLFGSTLPIPSYDDWMLSQDMHPTYARYADNLRLIGADAPGRTWLLKDPSTLLATDALLDVLPGARVLQTHRDPLDAMASVVSVLTGVRAAMAGRDRVGASIGSCGSGRKPLDARPRCASPDRDAFFDVQYEVAGP